MASSGGSFYQLPDELLLKIFSYLDIPDLVLNIQHVDSHWKAIMQDISFWKESIFTFDKKMTDNQIIMLLKNMPALRALVAKRGASNELLHTLCKTNKFITHLELHQSHKFTIQYLEIIVNHLPHIQHLAFPLFGKDSINAMKYSVLIQQLHELVSLRLKGYGFNAQNCFLKGIASKCPLLQEIDLGEHEFLTEDVILFLEAKKQVISKFTVKRTNSTEIINQFGNCKHLKALHFMHHGEMLPDMPFLDLPNLQHLGINRYEEEHFSVILRSLQKTTMSHLLKLDLGSCNLNAVQFENILMNCIHLKSLILKFCYLHNGDDFQHIAKCIHLEYLEAPNCMITDVAIEIFSAKCTKLRHLDLSYSPVITDFGFQCLMKCSELQTLKLSGTQIIGQHFHLIPLHLTKLSDLEVEYCDKLDFQYVQHLQEQMPLLQVYVSGEVTPCEDSVDLAGANIFTEACNQVCLIMPPSLVCIVMWPTK